MSMSDEMEPPVSTPDENLMQPSLRTFRRFGLIAGALVMLLGIVVLIGWIIGSPTLKNGLPGLVSMKANTAVCFVLSGISLSLLVNEHHRALRIRRIVARGIAAVIILIAAITILEYLSGWDLGIDQMLFREPHGTYGTVSPGRMALTTALSFLLTGTSLLLLDAGQFGIRLAQIGALLIGAAGLLSITGYCYGVAALHGIEAYAHMALNTAVGFVIVSGGLLCARPRHGLMGAITRDTWSAVMARRLLPAAIVVPLVLGWLRLKGEEAGYYDTRFGVALFVVTVTLVLGLLIEWTALALGRAETKRRAAEGAQRESERRYRTLTESLPQLVWTCLPDGKCDYLSPQWVEYTGIPEADQLGYAWAEQLYPSDRERIQEDWARSLKAGAPLDVEFRIRRHDGEYRWFKTRAIPLRAEGGEITKWFGTNTDISELKQSEAALKSIEWMLTKQPAIGLTGTVKTIGQPYGDLTVLNTERTILDAVGKDLLHDIVSDYMNLLETSSAVYEKNGDYAYGIFTSGWCQAMDFASFRGCGTSDNGEALNCGKWHCHESCWNEASRKSMESNQPTDIACQGGIRLYAVPIHAGEEIVGSINFGYGEPPSDAATLSELSRKYGLTVEELEQNRASYETRPSFIIEVAKERLLGSARLIGEIVQRHRAEKQIQKLNAELEQRVANRTAQLEAVNAALESDRALIEAIRRAQTEFIIGDPPRNIFNSLLASLLSLAESEYGFIDEMFSGPDGQPYLTARAITDISWNDETRKMYDQFVSGTLHFSNLNSLFGAVMTTGAPVIANDAPNDPRRCGIPSGHPALNAFLGLPLYSNREMVGVIGLANRPGGYDSEIVARLEPMVSACANLIAAWKNDQRRLNAETEQRRLNAELAQRSAQLQAVNKELEAFSYSVSHDLRAPLRHIDGFSQALLEDYEGKLDAAGQSYLREVRGASQQMAQLIDDVLQLARVSRTEMSSDVVNLSEIARNVMSDLRRTDAERTVSIKIEDGLTTQGDPRLLQIMLTNLLDNAWKFTAKRDRAEISFGQTHHNGDAVYFVRDNGAGFDMAYVGKLFGPFQRLHSSAEFEGTGIGLATVQRIVNRHGGRVWAEGLVNGGATIYFTLPN